MKRFALVSPLLVLLLACRTVAVAPPAPTSARNAADNRLLFATLWVQTAAEYDALALQSFTSARSALESALADRALTAAVEQGPDYASLPPAVVVDIDETVLDNSPFEARLIRDGGSYTEEAWGGWVEEASAPAIPGAAEFARYATSRGVTVFYVSNRQGSAEAPTRNNLAAAGFPLDAGIDTVLLRNERPEWSASDKASRREMIARTHRIVLMMGDDLGDFLPNVRVSVADRDALVRRHESWWGTRWFLIPNPMYGSWESVLASGAPAASRDQRLLDSLRTGR